MGSFKVVDYKASKEGRDRQSRPLWMCVCALAEESLPSHHLKGEERGSQMHAEERYHQGHSVAYIVWTSPTGKQIKH